jgi:hypothetical protein
MRRLTFLFLCVFCISLPTADGFAAAPGQGGRRCARFQRAAAPAAAVKMPAAASASKGTASLEKATGSDLERRVAALERLMADLERQQAQREAEAAGQPDFHGRAWMGTGGVGVRLGFEGFWDD